LYDKWRKVGEEMRADWVKIDNNFFEEMIDDYLFKKENNSLAWNF
jgi:hypothetical protein